MRYTSVALLVILASPAIAQTRTMAKKAVPARSSAVADIRANWKTLSGYVLQSAIDVPEDKYGFKASADVRSFAELFAHVAGSQSMFCAVALGEPQPPEDAVKATTKAALIDALRKSNADCDRAYVQSDAAASRTVDVFGERRSRLYALMLNATHDGEHYGNLVTYMRMNGLVPPSSKPTP